MFNLRKFVSRFAVPLLFFLAGVAVTSATPIPITGVTVTTAMGECCGAPVTNIVNGSGLSSYDPLATHDAGGNWLSTSKTGTVDFNLHGSWMVSSIAIWNTAYGVQDVALSLSTDGVGYTTVTGFPVTLLNVASGSTTTAEIFKFNPIVASYARLTITSGYSVGSSSGLKEVMFLADVPEPGCVSLMAVGLGGLVLMARRRKRLATR